MTLYFGAPYGDVPPDSVIIDTPVGLPCMWCGEDIEATDRGRMFGQARFDGDAEPPTDFLACHMECDVRQAVGSIAHLQGRCSCFGGKAEVDDGDTSAHEDARQVLAYIEAQNGRPL